MGRCSVLLVIKEMLIKTFNAHDHHSPSGANPSHNGDKISQEKSREQGKSDPVFYPARRTRLQGGRDGAIRETAGAASQKPKG